MAAMLCLAMLLSATDADDLTESRKHFEAGRALYSVNRFADAVMEFEAGFKLAPRPLFLFNIAQAQRRLAETTNERTVMLQARDSYRAYLKGANPEDHEREESTRQLAAIEHWLAEHPGDAPVAAVPAPSPVEPQPAPLTEAAGVSVAPPVEAAPPERGFFSRHPWVIPAAAAVLVAAAATGVYFGVRAANGGCPTASLGCVDAR